MKKKVTFFLKQQAGWVVFGKRLLMSLIVLELVACTMAPSSFNQPSPSEPPALPTATAVVPTRLPTATETLVPTPQPSLTPVPTATTRPFDLDQFSTRLYSGVQPYHYVEDTCQYLSNRWGEDKSSPDTVVVPIMYHSVRQAGKEVLDNMSVTEEYFLFTMDYAKKLGFETITSAELAGFLYRNEKIPPRSMILIIDDRRPGVARDNFMPVLEKYDWEVTLAYITGPAAPWEWMELDRMYKTGRIDVQAHGFMHQPDTYFTEFTEPEVIQAEVNGAIPLITEHFGKPPVAFIWPGGNFTPPAIEAVHQAGYQLAFTAYGRGPLFYNWIPLGEQEAKMNDPLMVLPRYWSTSATVNLDEAVAIQKKMTDFTEKNRAEEYRWYAAFCADYPPLINYFEEEFINE
ncbi:MAG: hypothetical protein CL609_16085 [Anaerolineaceae bacterium]|nr:hypothetical protein [Anaerolineaceae bacterium]